MTTIEPKLSEIECDLLSQLQHLKNKASRIWLLEPTPKTREFYRDACNFEECILMQIPKLPSPQRGQLRCEMVGLLTRSHMELMKSDMKQVLAWLVNELKSMQQLKNKALSEACREAAYEHRRRRTCNCGSKLVQSVDKLLAIGQPLPEELVAHIQKAIEATKSGQCVKMEVETLRR